MAHLAKIQSSPNLLPYSSFSIHSTLQEIIDSISKYMITALRSTTGSGKTIVTPTALYEAASHGHTDFKVDAILVSEPRKNLVASTVGYLTSVSSDPNIYCNVTTAGFEDFNHNIYYATHYQTLRYLVENPDTHGFDVVMIDEIHEVTMDVSLLIGVLVDMLEKGKIKRVVFMSASIDLDELMNYITSTKLYQDATASGNNTVFNIVSHDVERVNIAVKHAFVNDTALETRHAEMAKQILTIVRTRRMDDSVFPGVLFFVAGTLDIGSVMSHVRRLNDESRKPLNIDYREIDGSMAVKQQLRFYDNVDKSYDAIIGGATSIVENGATIPWITDIVSDGLGKRRTVDLQTGRIGIKTQPLSKARCNQQRGRAGRILNQGTYTLVVPEDERYDVRRSSEPSEIEILPLSELVITMAHLDISRTIRFYPMPTDFVSEKLAAAFSEARTLGILDENDELTAVGQFVAENSQEVDAKIGVLINALAPYSPVIAAHYAAALAVGSPLDIGDEAWRYRLSNTSDLDDSVLQYLTRKDDPAHEYLFSASRLKAFGKLVDRYGKLAIAAPSLSMHVDDDWLIGCVTELATKDVEYLKKTLAKYEDVVRLALINIFYEDLFVLNRHDLGRFVGKSSINTKSIMMSDRSVLMYTTKDTSVPKDENILQDHFAVAQIEQIYPKKNGANSFKILSNMTTMSFKDFVELVAKSDDPRYANIPKIISCEVQSPSTRVIVSATVSDGRSQHRETTFKKIILVGIIDRQALAKSNAGIGSGVMTIKPQPHTAGLIMRPVVKEEPIKMTVATRSAGVVPPPPVKQPAQPIQQEPVVPDPVPVVTDSAEEPTPEQTSEVTVDYTVILGMWFKSYGVSI